MFGGLQKLSLPDRVEGAPNYRRVPMSLTDEDEPLCYGTGMPTLDGLRRALEKMGAGPDGDRQVWWTCLREEPVCYVRGRPHVLRQSDQPLEKCVLILADVG